MRTYTVIRSQIDTERYIVSSKMKYAYDGDFMSNSFTKRRKYGRYS